MKMPESASGINPNDEIKKAEVLLNSDQIIVGTIKGKKEYFSPAEAINLINELSGTLMAYERCTRKH